MKQILFVIGVIAIACSCQPTQKEMTYEERQEIADVIREQFKTAIEFGEMTNETFDAFVEIMTEKDDEAWVDNPALWLNELYLFPDKEKVDEVWRPEPGESLHQKYIIDEDYVAVVSAECAIYVFKGSFAGVDKDGVVGEKVPMTGSYVYVLREGEWKWLHLHQSWQN